MLIFTVENMTCGHCVGAITQALTDADQNAIVLADVATKEVKVETTLEANHVLRILDEEGYLAQLKA